jgi:hypothetical protein
MWSDSIYWPWTVLAAGVDDHNYDPNTSRTYWDDSTSHYILVRAKCTVELDDPNEDPNRGRVILLLHSNELTWKGYECQYGFMNTGGAGGTALVGMALVDGFAWKNIQLLQIRQRDQWNGFWMVFQFESDGELNDPNGKYLRGAFWDGGKFDWDGSWQLSIHLGGDPNIFVEPNAAADYQYKGRTAMGIWTDAIWEAGFPADAAFDEIEVRTGLFTNVSRTLRVVVKNGEYGTITIDPDLLDDPNKASTDPNIPTDPEELRRYTDGTEVVLVAEAIEGKSFRTWKVFDPDHPGDPNHITQDANTVLYLTMDADYEIEAIFKCSSGGVMMPLGLVLLLLALSAAVRARW